MKFVRKGLKFYPKGFDKLDGDKKKQYIDQFSYKDPKAFFNSAVRKGWYDGKVCLCNKKDGSFPMGLITEHKMDEPKIKELEFIKIENPIYAEHVRPYQINSLDAFFKHNFGIIKVPTGGGKTVIAIEAIRLSLSHFGKKYKVMFLVDQKDLLEQSKKRIEEFLGCSVGIYSTGKLRNYEECDVILATIQTLQGVNDREAKRYKKVKGKKVMKTKQEWEREVVRISEEKKFLNKMLGDIRFLVIDEVHEFGSEARARLITDRFTGLNSLLALSATPFRKSDPIAKRRIIGYTTGVCYRILEQELVDEGHLADRKVLMIHYKDIRVEKFMKGVEVNLIKKQGQEGVEEEDLEYIEIPNYRQLYENFVIRNKRRNKIAACVIKAMEEFKRNSLCLFTRKEHGNFFKEEFGFPFLDGGSAMDEREKQKTELLKGDLGVLLASNIFNKGVDLPEINFLFNVGAGKGQEVTTQKKGRVLRRSPGNPLYNKAMLIDFYDDFEKIFIDHSEERLSAYRRDVGEDNIIFVKWNGDKEEFINDLLTVFSNWFK